MGASASPGWLTAERTGATIVKRRQVVQVRHGHAVPPGHPGTPATARAVDESSRTHPWPEGRESNVVRPSRTRSSSA